MRRRTTWIGVVLLALSALSVILSPTLRAAAHDFLQGFRLRRLMVVPYTLSLNQDTAWTLHHILEGDLSFESPEARPVQSLAEAEEALGFPVRRPAGVDDFVLMDVSPGASIQWTVNVGRLREALQAASAEDVEVPEVLQGTVITVTVGPIFFGSFEFQGAIYAWLHAAPPVYTMQPKGDVRPLAEAALRLIGMPAAEARRLAQTVDWGTTLLLPIPLGPGITLEVEPRSLGDREATLFTFPEMVHTPSGEALPARMLLWSDDLGIYLIGGPNADPEQLLRWARSLR
ncbi:MAG: hypothetical protein J7452_09025 [Thermoflexus sp.]|jgi:hypothetical protein|nr:hypothetical protein [Thermoflexus sp.]